jgi:hypothetical protein
MKQKNNWHSFAAVPFLLGLLFFANLANVYAGVVSSSATIYGVTTNNQLVRFSATAPGTVTNVGTITGLQTGENILGIDFRPATGQLYGLGSTSRLYVINKTTGAATSVGVLTTALNGTDFGFDFNPTVDRIRIVSNTGQNLRVNPNDASAIVDGAINGAATQPTAAAYTNNFAGATTTTLYDIDATTDTLYQQNPANSGTLTAVGALGVDFQSINGFDFFSGNNTAYAASIAGSGTSQLYTINLTTGAASLIGGIGGVVAANPLRGLAVDTGAAATAGFAITALTTANQLVRFNSNNANTPIGNPVSITGLQTGENILGIDFRPATGQLYGLGSTSRLYVINPVTGAATQIGAAGAFTLVGTNFGFDFNPTVDRIRVVSDTGQNLRLNPNDGTLTAADPNLNGAASGADAAGYTNSFGGATTTTLYDISSVTDTLYQQNPANAGTLITVGALGFDVTGVNGFDIANAGNVALGAFQLNGTSASGLYSIDLTTGAASFISPINAASPIRGLAIGSGSTATNVLDFDGDRIADYSVFRPSTGTLFIRNSSTGNFFGITFGNSEDIFTPGDYDGDGRTDPAVFRPSIGTFFVLRSSNNTLQSVQFGQFGDEPVARDYTGDGRTDFAVVRRVNGVMNWYVLNSQTNAVTANTFGRDTDVVAPGDYDGDGRFDFAVFRGAGGQPATFFVQRSSGGFSAVQFGLGSDLVVPGDYDGDGRTDYAVVRTGTNYNWYILRSSDNSFMGVQLGTKPQLTVQNDYDGDGKTDVAVWDPNTGNFFVSRSAAGGAVTRVQFGQNGDYPIANYDTH